jgi:hypothetical protein
MDNPDYLAELERLKEAHRQMGNRIPPQHLPQLAGLPEQWRLCATGNGGNVKDCFEKAWNSDPSKERTALQLLNCREVARLCIGAGVLTGPASGGLLVIDFDEPEDQAMDGMAEETFIRVFGKPSRELPVSATNSSGRKGRRKVFLQVPDDWWPVMGSGSIEAGEYVDGKGQKHALEVIWRAKSGKARQAVIAGDHPKSTESHPLAYQWLDGLHPAVVGVAVAPPWVLGGFIRYMEGARVEKLVLSDDNSFAARRAAGEPQPCDLLLPRDQRRLLLLMQKHWPYRGAPADSPFAASYQNRFRPLVAGLLNVLGIETALQWLGGQEWDRRNDWSDGNLGSFEQLMQSLSRSATDEEHMCGWGSIVSAALEGGFEWPKWALPPREVNADTLTTGVAKKVTGLRRALEVIEAMDSPLERECAYQNLGRALDCTERELKMLLRHIQEEDSPLAGGEWNEVVANAKPIEVAIERLLAFNALTIVASDGGVGKSVLLYRIAEAAANGKPFAGQLQTVPGNVLIIQKDESDSNLAAKDALMRAQMPSGRVQVRFRFNGGMLPELRKWIREHEARYVLMDSLFSLFGSDGDLTEGQIGTYMYLLNAMAAEEGCAILLTHHLRKGDRAAGKRTEIHMQDLFGSAFIVNGTSDVWGVIRDPESNPDHPRFLLKVLKPRTGVTMGGDVYVLSGSTEDLSFQVEGLNNSDRGVKELRDSERKVLEVLRGRSEETAVSLDEVAGMTNVSRVTCKRALARLMGDRSVGIQRVSTVVAMTGRPTYRYWVK